MEKEDMEVIRIQKLSWRKSERSICLTRRTLRTPRMVSKDADR